MSSRELRPRKQVNYSETPKRITPVNKKQNKIKTVIKTAIKKTNIPSTNYVAMLSDIAQSDSILDLVKNRSRKLALNESKKMYLINLISRVNRSPDKYALKSLLQNKIEREKQNYLSIFNAVDTYHDINEDSSRDENLKKFAKAIFGISQFTLDNFVNSFLGKSWKNVLGIARNSPSATQINSILSVVQKSPSNSISGIVEILAQIVRTNTAKPTMPSIQIYKYEFLKNLLLFQQLSGNIYIVGQKFCSQTDCQITLVRLANIIRKLNLKICIDAVKYSKSGYINLSGVNGISSRYLITNPVQIADSANTQSFSTLIYINSVYNDQSIKDVANYLMTLKWLNFSSTYQIHKQCESIQKYHKFTYFFVTRTPLSEFYSKPSYISKKRYNPNIDMFVVKIDPLPFASEAAKKMSFNVKYIIISQKDLDFTGEYVPLNNDQNENVIYSYTDQCILSRILRGPSVSEIGDLCDSLQTATISNTSSIKIINNENKLYALNLFCDIKRSQDSAQIEMVKNLNSLDPQKSYFFMTQDLLCASKALIENVNLIIENKGTHFMCVDISNSKNNMQNIQTKYAINDRAKYNKLQAVYKVLNALPVSHQNDLIRNLLKIVKNREEIYKSEVTAKNENTAANALALLGSV